MPLFIAIYWSHFQQWTLTQHDRFNDADDKVQITFDDALKRNEMILLGDETIGTKPPLTIRIFPDKSKQQRVFADGKLSFTIGRVCFMAGDEEIDDLDEQKLAWYLMCYGKWSRIEQPVKIVEQEVEYCDFQVWPEHCTEGQPFEFMGFLSEMISRQFLYLLSHEDRLSPNAEPRDLGIVIPENYHGRSLHLWRLIVHPNYMDFDG